jgi:hypothetical protein
VPRAALPSPALTEANRKIADADEAIRKIDIEMRRTIKKFTEKDWADLLDKDPKTYAIAAAMIEKNAPVSTPTPNEKAPKTDPEKGLNDFLSSMGNSWGKV